MTNEPASPPYRPRRNRWLPSIGLSLWLIFLLGLALSQWRLVMINADGDACLHWRIGHWMIEHHAVIFTDVFSHTRAGAPLISKEWLGEVLFAAAGDALGWNGIVVLAAVLIATCVWLLYRQLLAEGNDPLLSTALVLLAAWCGKMHWLARPHLLTHLLAIVFVWQLRLFDCGKLSRGSLFRRLVSLMVLWANLHGAFFTGLVIIATFLLGNALAIVLGERDARPSAWNKTRVLVALAVACALATCLNPNGWRLPLHVVEFLRDPILAHYVNEFRSPDFHSDAATGFLAELAVIACLLVFLRPKFSPTDIMVVGSWGLLALFAVRNIPIFAIVVTPILAQHFSLWLRESRDSGLLGRYRKVCADINVIEQRADGRWLVVLALALLVWVTAKPRLATEIMSTRFPVAAAQFLQKNPAAVHGEMFNEYGWGGYLLLALTNHPVFVDGRNDFYGPELIRDFDSVSQVHSNWDAVLQKYHVGWTILSRTHSLNELLALHQDWTLSYTDDVTTIYSRRSD